MAWGTSLLGAILHQLSVAKLSPTECNHDTVGSAHQHDTRRSAHWGEVRSEANQSRLRQRHERNGYRVQHQSTATGSWADRFNLVAQWPSSVSPLHAGASPGIPSVSARGGSQMCTSTISCVTDCGMGGALSTVCKDPGAPCPCRNVRTF